MRDTYASIFIVVFAAFALIGVVTTYRAIKRKIIQFLHRFRRQKNSPKVKTQYVPTEKNLDYCNHQKDLDQYLKNLDLAGIGLLYERQIGYMLEQQGYDVKYTGAILRKFDGGIDLVATNRRETLIIQTKYWAAGKSMPEDAILKLHQSTERYQKKYRRAINVRPVFYSTVPYSSAAHRMGKKYSIDMRLQTANSKYPLIKCNINENAEKIFHLPCDYSYDKTKIDTNKGELYAWTPRQAMSLDFRRARNGWRKNTA